MGLVKSIKQSIRKALAPRHAVILTYHSAVVNPASFPVWQHNSAAQLEEQFAWMARNCNCISLDQLVQELVEGKLRSDSVAITFDDGYANNLSVALPLLERYRLPATFFIIAGQIGSERLLWTESLACLLDAAPEGNYSFGLLQLTLTGPPQRASAYRLLVRHMRTVPAAERATELDRIASAIAIPGFVAEDSGLGRQLRMLTWNELRQLAASECVSIAAHTMSHPWLKDLPMEEARHEIVASRQLLEEKVGPVDYFAYPFGGDNDFGSEHRKIAIDAGFKGVFTAMAGCVTRGTDQFAVPRWGIGGTESLHGIEYALTGGLAAQSGLRRWQRQAS